ncbi:MAG TPA: zinc-dependent metalloprotease family protein [Pyrinomonadaceae bacterium]|nr:zinc-dependent metalloprotease family protein [Pyrinomonadaceae bacterium]
MRNRKPPRAVLLSLLVVSALAAAFFVSPPSSGQARARAREDVGRSLRDFDELSFDAAALLARARKEGKLSLHTSRGAFELAVEPFAVRADNYRAVAAGAGETVELARAPARWFRGEVLGVKGSRARFVLDGTDFQGVIVTPDETYFVEPAADFSDSAARGEYVFYAASAVKPSAVVGECGTLAERVGAEAAKHERTQTHAAAGGPQTFDAFAPKPETEIATESDFEFTQTFSASPSPADAANNDILNVISLVDAIYDAQLGVKLRVVFQRAWTTNTDPYTETASSPALFQLLETYNANPPAGLPQHDLVHMFTGKDMDGSTIGIAFRGVVCNDPGLSYGISQSKFNSSTTLRVALTAHEMGHNFGATHPNQETPVPSSCDPSIMNSFIQPTSNFCQFSRDQMTNHVSDFGSCLTRLTQPGCAYALDKSSQFFTAAGGAGAVGMTTGAGCDWGLAEGAAWIDTSPNVLVGPGPASYTVQPNTNNGPREASVDIAGQRLKVRQAASAACSSTQLAFGQTASGNLDTTDCRSGQPERTTALADLYTFEGRAGQLVRIQMNAAGPLDTFLYLFAPDGSIVASNDDIVSGSQTNSRIPLSGFFALPQAGVYIIEATSFNSSAATPAAYTVTLTEISSLSFTGGAAPVSETLGAGGLGTDGSGFRVFNVTRAGDTSDIVSVDFATSDGTADRRKDYEQTLGTLVFGPNETSKFFTVFVTDDALAEGPETVSLTLSNPVGAVLGATTTATLTVNDNDTVSAPSPVRAESFDAAFFVRQHYLDFLSREPDAPGFGFWQSEFNPCGSGVEAEQCKELKRVNVSAAFFLSIEFQNTGYLVYRFYKSAYGDATSPGVEGTVPVICLDEFLPDTQRIGQGVVVNVGNWQAQLEANKQAYAVEFVQRPRFLNAYPLSMSAAQFVDRLIQNSGVGFTQGERDQLVAQLSASTDVAAGRAAVLRQVADDSRLQQQEKSRAFVLMQYFGYLRRNPDDAPQVGLNYSGWKFWLDKLNQADGNFVAAEMVKAFLTSDEYVKRFGL